MVRNGCEEMTMDERSDQELKSALAGGELNPRKRAIPKEVLRRRYRVKERSKRWTYLWLPLIALLGTARMALRRVRGGKQDES